METKNKIITRGAKYSEEELEDMLYVCGNDNGLINYEKFVRKLMEKQLLH